MADRIKYFSYYLVHFVAETHSIQYDTRGSKRYEGWQNSYDDYHRENGPAKIYHRGSNMRNVEFWLNGRLIRKETVYGKE